jgi:ATP-dependent Lon protease
VSETAEHAGEVVTEGLAQQTTPDAAPAVPQRLLLRSPILCFVGPPGVGKTSLGRSIAHALGRKFVRISLGGVHDEAEIRGHRRTYVGALPGRIIEGIRQAGSNNAVFMLDEIDKVGSDFRGDPSSALLEVLDPEQNFSFADHYLEVPFDLSKVLFITTANVLDTIPSALRDRMEVIPMAGYTEDEKLHIAQQFLVPRQRREHGLAPADEPAANGEQPENPVFTAEALLSIIREHAKEAGVRQLERYIATICRKVARQVAEGKTEPVVVTPAVVTEYLGPARFTYGVAEESDQVGAVTGLAWTELGGDVMTVETAVVEGKPEVILTGQLGNVMQESARIALSYARSRARDLGIAPEAFEKTGVHIHVPAGAIPKDGPSAGITMATALISAYTGLPIRRDIAMTGEITLRGRVLPIGGLKEKVLAAHRAGITTVLFPKENLKDLQDIPATVREQVEMVPVSTMADVLERALVGFIQANRLRNPQPGLAAHPWATSLPSMNTSVA